MHVLKHNKKPGCLTRHHNSFKFVDTKTVLSFPTKLVRRCSASFPHPCKLIQHILGVDEGAPLGIQPRTRISISYSRIVKFVQGKVFTIISRKCPFRVWWCPERLSHTIFSNKRICFGQILQHDGNRSVVNGLFCVSVIITLKGYEWCNPVIQAAHNTGTVNPSDRTWYFKSPKRTAIKYVFVLESYVLAVQSAHVG